MACALSLIFQDTAERRAGAIAFAIAWIITLFVLDQVDGRTRAIRRVLGRSNTGSSDPATWKSDMFAKMPSPSGGFPAQVRDAIAKRRVPEAMRAARVCVAMGERALGEQLTDEVLANKEVAAALAAIGRDTKWQGDFRVS